MVANRAILSLMLLLMLGGCALKAPPVAKTSEPEPASTGAEASASGGIEAEAAVGVRHEGLGQVFIRHWRTTMERHPTWASALGHEAYDGRLSDPSAAADEAWFSALQGFRDEAAAIPDGELYAVDSVSRDLFVEQLDHALGQRVCDFNAWTVSARYNPYTMASSLPMDLPVTTPARAQATLSRLRALPDLVRQEASNLRRGLAKGAVANATSVGKVVDQLSAELERPADQWPLWRAVSDASGLSESEHEAFASEVNALIEGPIREAFLAYLEVLRDEVLPQARPDDRGGLVHLSFGKECYAALIARYTTLPDLTAEEIHQTGLAELESIHDEFRALGNSALGTGDLEQIFERLRTDPELYFTTEDEVEQAAQQALDRAREAMGAWFGRLPQRECIVERIPAHEAPFTTIAYYRPPTRNKPGRYAINTYAPQTRPRHEAEVLAFHESIPGHHLQIAIAQELDELPAFRRHEGMTVFVEGWALYTERLSDEMGLYSDDLSRLGMLSFDAWRAARLVVDTGLHHKGWSRDQAEAFMAKNTPLAANNIENEVDRYLTTPGQALAYKTGQIEIRRLRAEAEEALGDRFDLVAFHDLILGGGAVSLPVLRRQVALWVEAMQEP
ncbi:MAG: DUF885 domain-containing protein [Deltaproteobacteria bacterium]|nr:MAG: DUF885 domain-containing protein [Deltaproteobacteria bacterium]